MSRKGIKDMHYAYKKEEKSDIGNVFYMKSHYSMNEKGQIQAKEQENYQAKAVGEGPDSSSLETDSAGWDGPHLPPQRDIWIGYSAAVCLLMVLSSATVINIKKDSNNRTLASLQDSPEVKKAEENILQDLKAGRRELSSVSDPFLVKKEQFEYDLLKDYKVSYDLQGWVSHIQLKPDHYPVYIEDVEQFVKDHHDFFPPIKALEKKEKQPNEGEPVYVFSYSFPEESMNIVFRMNYEHKLVLMAVENGEK